MIFLLAAVDRPALCSPFFWLGANFLTFKSFHAWHAWHVSAATIAGQIDSLVQTIDGKPITTRTHHPTAHDAINSKQAADPLPSTQGSSHPKEIPLSMAHSHAETLLAGRAPRPRASEQAGYMGLNNAGRWTCRWHIAWSSHPGCAFPLDMHKRMWGWVRR